MKISFKNFNKTKILQILQKIKLNKDPNPKILQRDSKKLVKIENKIKRNKQISKMMLYI